MAFVPPAASALDGGDPRASFSGQGVAEYSRGYSKHIHDPSITTEEFFYWAKLTRKEEKGSPKVSHPLKKMLGFDKTKPVTTTEGRRMSVNMPSTEPESDEKRDPSDQSPNADVVVVSDEEWATAARAARTATWGAIFYLITTDVLGPYSVPWALSQMGYGPGITLYTIFGALAGYTGWQMWQMFSRLDSTRYPSKTFGDIAFRVYGSLARHLINLLQSIQLSFNVAVIVIGNGQGLYQVNSNICYIACCIIWAGLGMILGQIRTSQKFGWIANFAIWINIVVMIMTMAVVTHTAPNYSASNNLYGTDIGPPAPPVSTTGGAPAGVDFSGQIVGLMQAVYSYGGAMSYCEFMSEMRRPFDFWKASVMADSFIYFVYIFFGIYVYSFQGQYTVNPANQGMSPQGVLTAGNIIGFVSSLIAAALYGNIGIKVSYQNIFKELLGLPDLTTKSGKWIWVAIVPVYWGIAFVLGAAIPNFSALSGLVAASCIMQFTYTFPPLLMLGMEIKYDAIRFDEGEGFNPATGETVRHDKGLKRWIRGFTKGRWYVKTFNLIFFLGAFATCILGTYSSVLGIIDAFASGHAVAFSCKGPI